MILYTALSIIVQFSSSFPLSLTSICLLAVAFIGCRTTIALLLLYGSVIILGMTSKFSSCVIPVRWKQWWIPSEITCVLAKYCCDRKARGASAQSFTLWQQATTEIIRCNHSIILLVPATFVWVLFFAHISLVVNRTFNATPAERLQQYCAELNKRKTTSLHVDENPWGNTKPVAYMIWFTTVETLFLTVWRHKSRYIQGVAEVAHHRIICFFMFQI